MVELTTVALIEPTFWPTELKEIKTEKEMSVEVKIRFFAIAYVLINPTSAKSRF